MASCGAWGAPRRLGDASKTMTWSLRRKEMQETWMLSWIGAEELERDISEVLQLTDEGVAGV